MNLFAKRTQWVLQTNQFSQTLEALRQSKKEVYDLTESNPTRAGIPYPQEKILNAFANPNNLQYSPDAQGSLKAREALCAYYRKKGFTIDPKRIFLTASTSEGYSYLFRLLANAGERVIFPSPSYPLFAFLGDLNDVVMDSYPLVYDKQWQIDLAGLKKGLRRDTKAIVLVNPNNPTGSFVKKEELVQINALCREKSIALISDEVFYEYGFGQGGERVSLIGNEEALSFTLGGLSKSLGLPQMKLSWIIVNGPPKLVEEAVGRLEVIADTYLSVNTPVQNALLSWLDLSAEIQTAILTRTRANRDFLIKAAPAAASPIEVLNAEGGWYAVIRIPETVSEEDIVLKLLTEYQVIVHPGYFFDFNDQACLIVSLLPPLEVFKEGIERLFKGLANS